MNVWGVTPFDGYHDGDSVIGMECPNHSGIHVAEDLLVYEVVDHNNRPVPPNARRQGTRHRCSTASCRSSAMRSPIRWAAMTPVLATVGLPIDGRGGRAELPARGGGRVSSCAAVAGRLLRLPDVRQFDVAPQASGIRIRVVLRDAARRETALLEVRRAVAEELERAGAVVESLTVDAVERIERAGAGAKEKLVRPPIL